MISLIASFVYIRGAQPFRYCRPHCVYFYELRLPVNSSYFHVHCAGFVLSDFLVFLPHIEPSLLSHVCLTVSLLSIRIHYTWPND